MKLHPDIQRLRLGIQNTVGEHPYGWMRIHHGFGTMMREEPRLTAVWNRMPQIGADVMMEFVNSFLEQIDAMFIENPRTEIEMYMVLVAKELGIPVWCDWGDDILSLEPTHPTYQSYAGDDLMRKCMTKIIENSAVATVATDAMKETFPCSDKLIVLPDECRVKCYNQNRKKVISWRGMASHNEDVDSVLEQLCDVARDPLFHDWRFLLMGDPPPKLWVELSKAVGEDHKVVNTGQGTRVIVCPYLPTTVQMYDYWAGFAPFLHIVPLQDTVFNKGKSPNAWLEATGIGAAVIAPDFLSEWDVPGVIKYSNGKLDYSGKRDFGSVLRHAMIQWLDLPGQAAPKDKFQIRGTMHPNVVSARQRVFPDWTTEAVNKKRFAILNKLMGYANVSKYQELPVEAPVSTEAVPA
jgi:hypothetical protein